MHTDGLATWMLTARFEDLEALVVGIAERLQACGIALGRINLSLLTMHPEVYVRNALWTPESGCVLRNAPLSLLQEPYYLDSPVAEIHRGASFVRRRLAGPDARLDFPICREIASDGGTDYIVYPLRFTDGRRSMVSFATCAAGGFSPSDLATFEALLPALSARVEISSAHFATRSLLQVYLGPNAASRVLAGQFRRGSGTSIRAAIWTCDLRGFTAMSDRRPPSEVTATLDQYFERVVSAVVANGGEVLKFVGDAVLAVFPADLDPADAARRALEAATSAVAALEAWNAETGTPLGMGVALHYGEVFYGNIGGADRLDFTIIGAAVNEVCRLESLCKTLGTPIVASAAFREHLRDVALEDLGEHELRGVGAPQRVFGVPVR